MEIQPWEGFFRGPLLMCGVKFAVMVLIVSHVLSECNCSIAIAWGGVTVNEDPN